MKLNMKSNQAFTLIEILVVLTILSVLILAVFLAINPLELFAESRNAKRWNDTNSISTALYRYIIIHGGFPGSIDGIDRQIGTASTGCSAGCPNAADSCLSLNAELKPYLDAFPIDPLGGTSDRTLYSVYKTSDNVIKVTACAAENGVSIQVAR